MTYLELVQSLHYEAKQPGDPPTTVADQTGRAADFVRWIAQAWNDIQRSKDGRWKWLRREFYVDTVAGTQSYAYGACTDTLTAAVIDRFRAWERDEEDQFFIYLSSDGITTETTIPWWDWVDFRFSYIRATPDASKPACISIGPDDKLYLGPKPDDIYRLTGYYWRGLQTLTDDADVPEMPADFHELIVYRALVKYGYAVVSNSVLARARADGTDLWDALKTDQWYGRRRMRLAGAIA